MLLPAPVAPTKAIDSPPLTQSKRCQYLCFCVLVNCNFVLEKQVKQVYLDLERQILEDGAFEIVIAELDVIEADCSFRNVELLGVLVVFDILRQYLQKKLPVKKVN